MKIIIKRENNTDITILKALSILRNMDAIPSLEEMLPYLEDYRVHDQIKIIIVHEKKHEIIKMLEDEGFILDFI